MKRSVVLALLVLIAVIVCVSAVPVQAREEIKLTTIVPDQTVVLAKKGVVGTNYLATFLASPTTLSDNDLYVQGKIGIGTTTPQTPAPNALSGNMDVNDIYLRSVGGWVSAAVGGGGITQQVLLTNNQQLLVPRNHPMTAWAVIPGMTTTITTATTKSFLIIFDFYVVSGLVGASGTELANVGIAVDGNIRTTGAINTEQCYLGSTIKWIEMNLPAGTHTITAQWQAACNGILPVRTQIDISRRHLIVTEL